MEQSRGRSLDFVGVSREVLDLREGTPPNKKNAFQTRKTPFKQEKRLSNKKNTFQTRKIPFKQEKRLSSKKNTFQNKKNTFQARRRLSIKGYLPIKCKSLQVVGVSGQGKAVVSDAEETKGNGRRRWRGVGPAGRPSLFPFGVSVILKI